MRGSSAPVVHMSELSRYPVNSIRGERLDAGLVALDCWVAEPGEIRVGDSVELVELPAGSAA